MIFLLFFKCQFYVYHDFFFKINENGLKAIKVNGTKVKTQIKKVNVDGLVYCCKQAHGKREDNFF